MNAYRSNLIFSLIVCRHDVRYGTSGEKSDWPKRDRNTARPAVFEIKKLLKIGNTSIDSRSNIKSNLYTLNSLLEAKMSLCFILRPAVLEIQGCRKSENHSTTPEWPQALNCQKYPVYTVKSTLYTLNTQPRGSNFTHFCSTTYRFRDTRLSKIGNTQYNLRMTSSTYLSKVPCILWILPPRPKFHSTSLYDQPFSRHKVVENRQCTEWPQIYPKHLAVKMPCLHWILIPEVEISLRFALWSLVFHIFEIHHLNLIRYNGEFQNFVRNQNVNSKI